MALKRKLKKDEHAALADAVKALYVAKDDGFILDAEEEDVTGLKNTVEATRTERDALKLQVKEFDTLKARVAAFGDLDPEKVRALMARFENNEEAQMLKDGKSLDEIFTKRTEKMALAHKRELDTVRSELDTSKKTASQFTTQVLDNHLLKAMQAVKAFPEAAEAFLLLGRQQFSLGKDGQPVALKDGEPIIGKDGKTPLSIDEWSKSLVDTAPYLFPAPSGGGASGGGGKGGSKTLTEAEFTALGPKERAAKMADGYTISPS